MAKLINCNTILFSKFEKSAWFQSPCFTHIVSNYAFKKANLISKRYEHPFNKDCLQTLCSQCTDTTDRLSAICSSFERSF